MFSYLRKQLKRKDTCDSFELLYYYGRLLGMMPFDKNDLRENNNCTIVCLHSTKYLFAYNIGRVLLMYIGIYFVVLDMVSKEGNNFESYLLIFIIIEPVIIVSPVLLHFPSNHKYLLEIFTKLRAIDKKMSMMSITIDWTFFYLHTIIFLIIIIGGFVVYAIFLQREFVVFISENLTYGDTFHILLMGYHCFGVLLLGVHVRIRSLNERIMLLKKSTVAVEVILKDFMDVHQKLCKIAMKTNSVYGGVLLCAYIKFVEASFVALYGMIRRKGDEIIFFSVIYVVGFVVLVIVCTKVDNERKSTARILSDIAMDFKSNGKNINVSTSNRYCWVHERISRLDDNNKNKVANIVAYNINYFLLQMLQNETKFTVCGLFPMNLKMLANSVTFFTTLTTMFLMMQKSHRA